MSLYKIVDHRAPKFFPHDVEPHLVGIGFMVLMGVCALFTSVIFLSMLFSGGVWWLIPGAVLALQFAMWKYCLGYVHRIPRVHAGGYIDMTISEDIERMQSFYRGNPHVKDDLEPLLISAYTYAVKLDAEAVRERYDLMREYVKENPAPRAAIESYMEDPEIADFKLKMQVRREMRAEGLL